jgi:hypothetical protein
MFRPTVDTYRAPVAVEGNPPPLRHLLPISRSSPVTDCTLLHSCSASCDEHTPLPDFPAHDMRFSSPDRRCHYGSAVGRSHGRSQPWQSSLQGQRQLREAGIYSKDREGYNLFQSEDRIA